MILNDKIEYEIEFYEDSDGHSDIDDFLNNLATKALKSKDARIQFRIRKTNIFFCIILSRKHKRHLEEKLKEQKKK